VLAESSNIFTLFKILPIFNYFLATCQLFIKKSLISSPKLESKNYLIAGKLDEVKLPMNVDQNISLGVGLNWPTTQKFEELIGSTARP